METGQEAPVSDQDVRQVVGETHNGVAVEGTAAAALGCCVMIYLPVCVLTVFLPVLQDGPGGAGRIVRILASISANAYI